MFLVSPACVRAGWHKRTRPQPGPHHAGPGHLRPPARGAAIRIVTESLWRGRSDAETAEVMKHEGLVRLTLGPGRRGGPVPLQRRRARPVAHRRRLRAPCDAHARW